MAPAPTPAALLLAFLLALMLAVVPPAGAAKRDAEFALRWDPRQGGPATPVETLRGLQLKASDPTHFEIRYFDFSEPAGVPAGFETILRKRDSDGRTEWTFKLRGSQPLPAKPSLRHWACPLGAAQDRKDEADVTFVAAGRTVVAYSRSCSLQSQRAGLEPPAALQARPRGCGSTMTRVRAGRLKVEEWKLSDGTVLLEASRPGRHEPASMRAFEREVLQPLLALGVQPLERSKSALGGDCAR